MANVFRGFEPGKLVSVVSGGLGKPVHHFGIVVKRVSMGQSLVLFSSGETLQVWNYLLSVL